MKVFLIVLLNLIVCSHGHVEEQFKRLSHSKLRSLYAEHYEGYKKYAQEYKADVEDERPEPLRLMAYARTVEEINRHNELYEKGETTFKLGLNHMADVATEEFTAKIPEIHINITPPIDKNESAFDLPETVDWVKKGYVSPVKNQNWCWGAADALAATGAVEAMRAISKKRRLLKLSAQEVLDCGEGACNKIGTFPKLLQYIKEKRGLNSERRYPWTGKKEECKSKAKKRFGIIKFLSSLRSNSMQSLKAALSRGPVVVFVYGGSSAFKNYKEGIFRDENAPFMSFTQTMLAVGYGKDYILLKNSWGTDWGENGYMRITTDPDANCNVAGYAMQPM